MPNNDDILFLISESNHPDRIIGLIEKSGMHGIRIKPYRHHGKLERHLRNYPNGEYCGDGCYSADIDYLKDIVTFLSLNDFDVNSFADKSKAKADTEEIDPINPTHYPNAGTNKDLIAHWLDIGWESALAANIQKYTERAVTLQGEDKLKSLRKAQEYNRRWIEFLKSK
jgi:hypothetical protein